MSGNSYGSHCPNCGEGSDVYTDHKPFEYTIIQCIHCGLSTEIKLEYHSLEELNELRLDMDLDPLKELPDQTFEF